MNRSIISLSLICLSVATSGWAADKPRSASPAPSSQEVVLKPGSTQFSSLKMEAVTAIPAPASEPLNGKIAFDENHTVRISSPVTGRVVSISAQLGDTVKSGQALAVLDSPDLGTALADHRKAQADLQLKKQALERSRLLLEGGVIARKEFENSQADMAESQAEAARTSAMLSNLGTHGSVNGESFSLRSPINGMIVDRQINPGSQVRPDAASPLFIISDPNSLWASIDLPERDLSKVSVGQALAIEVDAYPGETFSGRVLTIGGMVDPATRRIQVRCSVDGKGRLKPEMYARITPLQNSQEKVIRLPNSALITEGLYSYVFVETSPGHLQKRRVELATQARDYATVKNGLALGERVVTSGAILLNSELAAGK